MALGFDTRGRCNSDGVGGVSQVDWVEEGTSLTSNGHGLVAALLAAVFVLSACGAGSDGGRSVAAGERAAPRDAPVAQAVDGLRRFGFELYGEVSPGRANVVISPLSIGYAFAMARAGAAGSTGQQIDAVLHFPLRVHDAFNDLDRRIVTQDTAPRPAPSATRTPGEAARPAVVAVANGLFPDDDVQVKDGFLQVLVSSYGVGVELLDYARPEEAMRRLDGWAVEKTAGRIQRMVDGLDPATRLVLANAVYFRADWDRPFAVHRTGPAPFTLADGSTVAVPTMSRQDEMLYAQGDGWQAVQLDYSGGDFAMWVLVPDDEREPGPLLDPTVFEQIADRLEPKMVDLYLPRWDFETDLDLVPPLSALGMSAPFAGADFSAMADEPVSIDQAVHRANITVDEWGTEAAAITALAFAVSAPPEPEATVRADHPFAFVVVHTPTGTPLFVGHVGNPSTTS